MDIQAQCQSLISDIKAGRYKNVYLLMGEESYYPELVCNALVESVVDESFKDFNEVICFGADVTAEQIVTLSRQYPMMADYRLVVVKEAQMCKTLDQLSVYCDNPLDSTVLVLLLRGASADKRKALYKTCAKKGVVVDSPLLRDYEVPKWIAGHFAGRGLTLEAGAAELMAESVGTSMSTICMETDKLVRNLPEGQTRVSVADIEKNIGVSREYSIFELTKALSFKSTQQAMKIAERLGDGARFAMPMAVSSLFTHFNRILRYGAALQGGACTNEQKAQALAGVNPYFYREYDTAVRNYPLPKAMQAISLLCEYDYLGKGGDGGQTEPGQLLIELTAKLLNL